MDKNPVEILGVRNITVSGRIAAGTTTLAAGLSKVLGWELLEGGALFEKFHHELKLNELEVSYRPDSFDVAYEDKVKSMLKESTFQIIQSHLAGFDAQGIEGVYKILIICEDAEGKDKSEIRIDRLVNRKGISVEEAKEEVRIREYFNLEKWRRLYANNDQNWVYWDPKYYDLLINTYSHNQEDALKLALEKIGYKGSFPSTHPA